MSKLTQILVNGKVVIELNEVQSVELGRSIADNFGYKFELKKTRFNSIVEILSHWRDKDHEDVVYICRSDIVELIEGIKELKNK